MSIALFLPRYGHYLVTATRDLLNWTGLGNWILWFLAGFVLLYRVHLEIHKIWLKFIP